MEDVMRNVAFVFVVFGLFVYSAAGQMTALSGERGQNLQDCVDGFSTCNYSLF